MNHNSDHTPPIRLRIAVYSSLAATLLVTAIAIYRTGIESWIGDVIRPVGLALFTILSVQGRGWARRLLMAWLGISVLVFLANLVAAFGQPALVALLLAQVAFYVWALLELASAEMNASHTRSRSGGRNAAA